VIATEPVDAEDMGTEAPEINPAVDGVEVIIG
jgi:hypothetical protein